MLYRFPYTRISNPSLSNIAKFRFHPLIKVGPENTAYFHNLTLVIFKNPKNLKLKDSWQIKTKIGLLEKPIGFAGVLGVYGFLDQFSFMANIPEGYFEIEPLFE